MRKLRLIMLLIAVTFLFTGCLGDWFCPGHVDIENRVPYYSEQEVALDIVIEVQFSEEIEATGSGEFIYLTDTVGNKIPGTAWIEFDTMKFDPNELLLPNTTYKVRFDYNFVAVNHPNALIEAEPFFFTTTNN